MRLRDLVALVAILAVLALAIPAPVSAGPDDTLSQIPVPGTTTAGHRIHTDQTYVNETIRHFLRFGAGVTFANLFNLALNGVIVYCSDCTIANPCAGSGTGAIAKRLNGVWVCN